MNKNELYLKLKKTYSEENLHKITRKLIGAYQKKETDYFEHLFLKLGDFLNPDSSKINKLFFNLIMLYHPDKLKYYQNQIEHFYQNNEETNLKRLSHIFITLKNLNYLPNQKTIDAIQNPSRSKDYGDSVDLNDFDTIVDLNNFETQYFYEGLSFDFLSALKIREFGDLNFDIQSYHLEHLTGDLNFSRNRINDLTGIEKCSNISSLDFSNNEIVDITNLGFLTLLEEIDLSDNEIYAVDGLANLHNLQILDLAFNHIDDISPLYELERLRYINLVGNPIPQAQIKAISRVGRIVVS